MIGKLFLADPQDAECRDYHHLKLNSTCQFMKTTDDCQIDDGFINYLVLTFCDFSSGNIWLSLFLLVSTLVLHSKNQLRLIILFQFCWLFVLFIGLGVTADSFFCPSLRVIADKMRLSQNIAISFCLFAFVYFQFV